MANSKLAPAKAGITNQKGRISWLLQNKSKQIDKNTQKSTGSKTDEGKAAVSQNAVKHGLFAAEVVITGEDPADYEAFHDVMFAEMAPAGAVELMLAERVVSLSWRLQRAERMQNEVIEDMIGRKVTNNPARRARECYYINQGIYRGDPRMDLDDLPLGRIATSDFSYCRVLDRMLMYERRIENSMMKTMRELERQQLIRQFQQKDAEQYEPSPSLRDSLGGHLTAEAVTRPAAEKKGDLKKQSQFVPGLMGVTPFLKGDYDNKPACGADENKAKRSQFQPLAPTERAKQMSEV